jgi:Rrf2 family protein
MKLSKKAYYGLRASLALVSTKEPLSIHVLAKQEHIPEDYLEKILQELRRRGVVTAKRGTAGGYTLTKSDLSAWDVVSALDGPLTMYAPTIKGALPCFQETHCQANALFRALEDSLEETLKDIPLSSLARVNTKVKQ